MSKVKIIVACCQLLLVLQTKNCKKMFIHSLPTTIGVQFEIDILHSNIFLTDALFENRQVPYTKNET